MKDIVLAAEELNDLPYHKKLNWFQRKINRFFYNKIKKEIFKEIRKSFLCREDRALIYIPSNYKEREFYEDVLEHFRFLGYKVENGISYYHIKWPNKQEQKNNRVANNTEDEVIKDIKSGKGLRSI